MKTKIVHRTVRTHLLALATAAVSLFSGSCQASAYVVSGSESKRSFFEKADLDPAVPNPETVTGHRLGEKAVRYDTLVLYLEALARSSRRVRLASYGESHKGQRLNYLTVTSTDNHTSLRGLEIDDTFKIKNVGRPELSPDGKWMACTVTTRNFEENSSRTRIWMMATEDGEPVPMAAEAVSSQAPKFSRDGKKLYFLSARNGGKSQIWSLDLRTAANAAEFL